MNGLRKNGEKMKWKPFKAGVPYTCQDCPGRMTFEDMRRANQAIMELIKERDKWRKVAEAYHYSGDPDSLLHAGEMYRQAENQ